MLLLPKEKEMFGFSQDESRARFTSYRVSGSVYFVQCLGLGLLRTESRARFTSYRVSGSVYFVQSLGLGLLRTESRARFSSYRVSGSVYFVQSLGLGLLRTESRARILLKLSSLGLGFSNKGLGVSASLGFYHSPPLLVDAQKSFF